jgi:hypothetical protein
MYFDVATYTTATSLIEERNNEETARLTKKESTTAQLLRSLILHEVRTMEDALRDALRDKVADSDRRRLRWEIQELRHRAQFLMNWLTEARLETPKN